MDDAFWSVSDQAQVQLQNKGVDVDDVLECLDTHGLRSAAKDSIRVTVQLYELRLVVKGPEIQSVTVDRAFVQARTTANSRPSLTQHAKQRMKQRNITQADIDEALTHPRKLGAIHRGTACTVVIGTARGKGERVITVYRECN